MNPAFEILIADSLGNANEGMHILRRLDPLGGSEEIYKHQVRALESLERCRDGLDQLVRLLADQAGLASNGRGGE